MAQYQSRRVMSKRRFDDPARVDDGSVNRSFVQNFVVDDVVLHIEKYDHEGFVRKPGELYPREVSNGLG